MSTARHRSSAKITGRDLRHLAELARSDFDCFFRRYKQWRPYSCRLLLICLCQGAARHYVKPTRVLDTHRKGGVSDFDVWGFFRDRLRHRPFPPRRHGRKGFGQSKFGQTSDEPRLIGRRVDIFGRSIRLRRSETCIQAVHRYLREPPTLSWQKLQKSPVVVIWPAKWRRKVIWKPADS
jgi:hypothetical protein